MSAATVYRSVTRADRAVADAFARLGVATAHEAHERLAEKGLRYVD